MDLKAEARSYLEAEGFEVEDPPRGERLGGERSALAGGTERIFVWTAEPGSREFERRFRPVLRDMDAIDEANPQADKVLLVPHREGISSDVSRRLRDCHVRTQTPIQFFDTNFRWESGRGVATAASRLAEDGRAWRSRLVPQPYVERTSGASGDDLLLELTRELQKPATGAAIHVIAGPAGIGKTVLFKSLYAAMFDDFQARKRRRQVTARPVPLLPEYLDAASARTVRSLLDAFLRTEFVRSVHREVFEWMLLRGYALWMLDGLDEVISLDPDFLELLEDLVTRPGAERGPRVLICVRDSLLATDQGLRELGEYEDLVRLYEVDKWNQSSIDRYARLRFDKTADDFTTRLSEHAEVRSLASLPFYCTVLADLHEDGELARDYTESTLLDHAVERMIEREYEKGTITRSVISSQQVSEYVEDIAVLDFEAGHGGVDVERAEEFAEIVAEIEAGSYLDEAELERLKTNIVQLPFFAQGGSSSIRFAQEMLQQFFVGRRLSGLVVENPSAFGRALRSTFLEPDSLVVRMVADAAMRAAGLAEEFSRGVRPGSTEFRNLLQVELRAGRGDAHLRNGLIHVGYDVSLQGIVFDDCDLTGVSFRGSDLTDVRFRNTRLVDVNLEDAILRNTGFDEPTSRQMKGAAVGALTRFFSIDVRGEILDDLEQAGEWFAHVTGATGKSTKACAAAEQLRHLYKKYIHPDGSRRRSRLSWDGLVRGKRYLDPAPLIEASLRYGYLRQAPPHGYYETGDVEQRRQMIDLVQNRRLSAGLRALLDDVCDVGDCVHIP